MDTLNAYGSEDEDDGNNVDDTVKPPSSSSSYPPAATASVRRSGGIVEAAPAVPVCKASTASTSTTSTSTQLIVTPAGRTKNDCNSNLILYGNLTKDVLYQPVQGPQVIDPSVEKNKSKQGSVLANIAVDEITFAEQRAMFQREGQAAAPLAITTSQLQQQQALRTTLGYNSRRLEQFSNVEEHRRKRQRPINSKQEELVQGSEDEAEYGIWGPPTAEERFEMENTVTDLQKGELAPEQMAERAYITERNRQRGIDEEKAAEEETSAQERLVERKMAHLLPPKASDAPISPSTTFHGSAEFDYKGQFWMAAPAGLGSLRADIAATGETMSHKKCLVPTKCVHRCANAHEKGVHRIRLFPVTGHLLLSAGLDGKCKVFRFNEAANALQLMRTYIGHSAAVRDVQFNRNGKQFVSASFDRYLRLWDTESGRVIQTFTNRKVPYVVQFYPFDDRYFVAGCSDNKIVCYDTQSGNITQEYNHHLAPVNAIVFVVEDEAAGMTKMVSSSDDKKVLVWEWDIGVPIKYISDPSMHSIPCLINHPTERCFVGQSLDNTIVVFQSGGKFSLQRKKKFSGHVVSGYACEMAISPDGRFLTSGDGNGCLWFWDWKRHAILQKYRAHTNGPTICCVWHPLERSVVFTCGWDGTIKVWK